MKYAVLLQAIWKLVIMRVHNIPVEDEHSKGMFEKDTSDLLNKDWHKKCEWL